MLGGLVDNCDLLGAFDRSTDLEARKQSGGETSGLGSLSQEEGRGKRETL